MHKKFEINQTKIKGGSQSERKVVTHDSKSDLPLARSDVRTRVSFVSSKFRCLLDNHDEIK